MNFLKTILTVAAVCFAILYLTRTPMDITADDFIKAARSYGYKTGRTNVNNAKAAYVATKGKNNIFYVKFNSEEAAQEYYKDFINQHDVKYSEKISRDLYLLHPCAEKKSYVANLDEYYTAVYAKDSVIHAVSNKLDAVVINEVINALYVPSKIDISQFETLFSQLSANKK